MRFCGALVVIAGVLLLVPSSTVAVHLRRCIDCRSRGDLGSCKDPFTMNSTQIETEKGLKVVPCASGWCMKIIESKNLNNEYGIATERSCLQRGPDDNEERCDFTTRKNKRVFMCYCNGDLCNSSTMVQVFSPVHLITLITIIVPWIMTTINCEKT